MNEPLENKRSDRDAYIDFVSVSPASDAAETSTREAEQCLDRFTAAFNACDTVGMDAELHFPHLMLSGSQRLEWVTPGQHPDDFFVALKRLGWHHTQYESKQPIVASEDKVHFVVTYTRRGSDNDVISTHVNLWVVTRNDARWGICLRSY